MSKVKHIALFKFKEGTTEEQIDKVFEQLMDLSENVEGIEDYVSGPNNSPENMSQGYTHGYVMTFADTTARDAYLPHPEHKKFGKLLGPVMADVFVIDYWAKE